MTKSVHDVVIVHGPPRAGKSAHARGLYVEQARAAGAASALFLLPTVERAREERMAACDALGGVADTSCIVTFPELARLVLSRGSLFVGSLAPALSVIVMDEAVRRVARQRGSAYLEHAAAFPGFTAAALALVGELKRAALPPAEAPGLFARADLDDARTHELLDVYAEYQRILKDHGLMDDEGAFWWALDMIRRHPRALPEELSLVVVDGFMEFTQIQLKLLSDLQAIAGKLVITFTDGPEGNAPLAALWGESLKALRDCFPGVRLEPFPIRSDALAPPLRHAVSRLFQPGNDRLPDDGGCVRILAAHGERRQFEEAARECKRLILEEGARPDDIGIVARSADSLPGIAEALERFGVPAGYARETLADAPSVKHALSLLRLKLLDFPRNDVIAGLRAAAGDEPIAADVTVSLLDRVSRKAGVVRGRKGWLGRLDLLAYQLGRIEGAGKGAGEGLAEEDLEDLRDYLPGDMPAAAVREARDAVSMLFDLYDAVPDHAPRGAMAAAFRPVIEALSPVASGRDTAAEPADAADAAEDKLAIQSLYDLLEEIERLDEKLGGRPVDLGTFLREVHEAAASTPTGLRPRRAGGVRVVGILKARQLHFEYVFLVGLNEGGFPPFHREDLFFRDPERLRLHDQGVYLPTRHSRQLNEARLFQEALSRGSRRAYLLYAAADADGREVVVSHFVDEVGAAFEKSIGLRKVSLNECIVPAGRACSPFEALMAAACALGGGRACVAGPDHGDEGAPPPPRDPVALQAATWLLQSNREAAPGLRWGPLLENALHAARVERRRSSAAPFDHHDGVLSSPAAAAALAAKFTAKEAWSASEFELYGDCPFAFFARRLLGLAPFEEPSPELDAASRGRLYHEILRDFHSVGGPAFAKASAGSGAGAGISAGSGAGAGTWAGKPAIAEARERLLRCVDEVFRKKADLGWARHRGLWEAERGRCRDDMAAWIEADFKLAADGHRPFVLEAAFGPGTAMEPAVDAGGRPLRLRGRIDRVDLVGDDGYALFDYKTGRAPLPKDIRFGRSLQLPIYFMALANHPGLQGRRCARWAYVLVRKRPVGVCPAGAASDAGRMEEQAADARAFIARRFRDMLAGRFQPAWWAASCGYCDFRSVCRATPERLLRKIGVKRA